MGPGVRFSYFLFFCFVLICLVFSFSGASLGIPGIRTEGQWDTWFTPYFSLHLLRLEATLVCKLCVCKVKTKQSVAQDL